SRLRRRPAPHRGLVPGKVSAGHNARISEVCNFEQHSASACCKVSENLDVKGSMQPHGACASLRNRKRDVKRCADRIKSPQTIRIVIALIGSVELVPVPELMSA